MIFFLSLVLLFSKFSAAIDCSTTTITSQSDADTLSTACPKITGDVIFSPNISGPIDLSGIQSIQGSLSGGPCSSSCSSFTFFTSNTLKSITGNLSLDGITNIISIQIPQLQSVGGAFALNDLASLQNLSVHDLGSVGQFQITSVPNLSTLDLVHLKNVTGPSPLVEVTDVALANATGLNPLTSLSSFIFRNVPNLRFFSIDTPNIDYFEITANQTPPHLDPEYQLLFNVQTAGTVNISGLGALDFYASTIDNLVLSRNWGSVLSLQYAVVTNNLSIVDNENLSYIVFPLSMTETRNIQITGNTFQRSGQDVRDYPELVDDIGRWPWSVRRCNSMVFEGNISDVVFKTFQRFRLVEVTNGFSVNSSAPTFNCAFLNSLRSQGYFQGPYSCQGTTLPAGPVRRTADVKPFSGANAVSMSMFGCLFGVALAFTMWF